ncbi:monocarboxylate transporter 2 isoform X2 [Hyalella azteca]|uniref:Monocarboxylate transporter 2 isoform X2 n=1 Tax=Hyalella azteca TaxID=294128 RepID=A0A979FJH3_HYAAZ|nr:monocarboxylate transporter 2 isoform X2 [Hyalella azteca]
MTLKRSKSLPGVGGGVIVDYFPTAAAKAAALWRGSEKFESVGPPQDSGVVVGSSENPSFISDPRSSLVGDLASGALVSELPSAEEVVGDKVVSPDDECKQPTIGRHYYPEGGWGWLVLVAAVGVNVITHGLHQSVGVTLGCIATHFPTATPLSQGVLGAMSTSLALLISPLTIAICRRKSTRLTAVIGGLVTALGCLFTSFARQYHQLFFSYGTVVGIGVGLTRDSSTLMVGQYFKRRREAVEVLVVGGSGLGISAMSAFVRGAVSSLGWRLGLQAVTCVVFLTFLMGTFYRSASLYHPQRRAILHLKNQKRKVKEKARQADQMPFFDVTTLRSRTIQILLVSTSLSSFGITTPILYMAQHAEQAGLQEGSVLLLQTYLGLGWFAGCLGFGFLTVHRSADCRVGLQYLLQAAMFLCGVTCLAFTAVEGYPGYVLFSWLYGIFCGGFHYALKMFTYEKVRARNFARTWGFVQCTQALPTALGVPITGYINVECGHKAGYYFSSSFIIVGSMTFFLIDVHRRHAARHRHSHKCVSGMGHTCARRGCPNSLRPRRDSLAGLDPDPVLGGTHPPSLASLIHNPRNFTTLPEQVHGGRNKAELTCISEEGIADMDLPDHLLEELDYLGDCITSCDKVENYLMRSEYENNLIIRAGDNGALSNERRANAPLNNERRNSALIRTGDNASFNSEKRGSALIRTSDNTSINNERRNNILMRTGDNVTINNERRLSRLRRTLSIRAGGSIRNTSSSMDQLEDAATAPAAGGSEASSAAGGQPAECSSYSNKFPPCRHITVIEEASV